MRRILLPLLLLASCAGAPMASDQAAVPDPATEERLTAVEEMIREMKAQMELQFELPGYTIFPPLRVNRPEELDQQMAAELKRMVEEQVRAQQGPTPPAVHGPRGGSLEGWAPVPATPRAELELVEQTSHEIRLDLKLPNPIGGPTVHHYRLVRHGEGWRLETTGSTEYL